MTEYDITAAFRAIENELIKSMINNMGRHKAEEEKENIQWTQWQAEQLKALEQYKINNQKKYKKQFRRLNKAAESLIETANASGNMEQEIEILEAIKNGFKGYKKASQTMQAEFFKINERKLEALIKATTDDMKKAETAILRMANDKYRSIIFNAQVYANTGAGTYEKAVDMATKDMLAAGLNCVEYSNGARHTLSDYIDMAIRTASKRAYLQGEGTKRQEWGISLVILNKRGNPCPKCLPFCGKVLIDDVWSGGKPEDGDYPLMSYAIEQGLYHPRCKDSHTTYFKGVSTADDTWTKKELENIGLNAKKEAKKQYAERQAEKFERLEKYSLDKENKHAYKKRTEQWNSIIDNTPAYKQKTIESISKEATEALLDSYDDRRMHFGMNMTSAGNLRKMGNMNPVTVNYNGVSLETAQAFDDTIQKLSGEYYTGFTKIKVGDKKEFFGANMFATTQHNNMVGQKTLVLNPHKTNDYGKLTERIKELSDKGYAVRISEGLEGQYVATHEFAHSLIDLSGDYKNYVGMDVKHMKGIKKELDSVFESYKSEVSMLEKAYKEKELAFLNGSMSTDMDMKELAKIQKEAQEAKKALDAVKISKYSMENADEFIAEAFTQDKIGVFQSKYTDDVMDIIDKHFKKKSLVNSGDSDIIEMYRKGSTYRKLSSSGKKIIDDATYHKITNPAIKAGADIRIAEGEYLKHIQEHGTAVTIGDVIYFTPEKTVSDVLEEVHHFYQNKKGLNRQYDRKQREILNEIDAKEYLLSVASKYKIPQEEIEETKQHLKSYKKQMEEMKERGEWSD